MRSMRQNGSVQVLLPRLQEVLLPAEQPLPHPCHPNGRPRGGDDARRGRTDASSARDGTHGPPWGRLPARPLAGGLDAGPLASPHVHAPDTRNPAHPPMTYATAASLMAPMYQTPAHAHPPASHYVAASPYPAPAASTYPAPAPRPVVTAPAAPPQGVQGGVMSGMGQGAARSPAAVPVLPQRLVDAIVAAVMKAKKDQAALNCWFHDSVRAADEDEESLLGDSFDRYMLNTALLSQLFTGGGVTADDSDANGGDNRVARGDGALEREAGTWEEGRESHDGGQITGILGSQVSGKHDSQRLGELVLGAPEGGDMPRVVVGRDTGMGGGARDHLDSNDATDHGSEDAEDSHAPGRTHGGAREALPAREHAGEKHGGRTSGGKEGLHRVGVPLAALPAVLRPGAPMAMIGTGVAGGSLAGECDEGGAGPGRGASSALDLNSPDGTVPDGDIREHCFVTPEKGARLPGSVVPPEGWAAGGSGGVGAGAGTGLFAGTGGGMGDEAGALAGAGSTITGVGASMGGKATTWQGKPDGGLVAKGTREGPGAGMGASEISDEEKRALRRLVGYVGMGQRASAAELLPVFERASPRLFGPICDVLVRCCGSRDGGQESRHGKGSGGRSFFASSPQARGGGDVTRGGVARHSGQGALVEGVSAQGSRGALSSSGRHQGNDRGGLPLGPLVAAGRGGGGDGHRAGRQDIDDDHDDDAMAGKGDRGGMDDAQVAAEVEAMRREANSRIKKFASAMERLAGAESLEELAENAVAYRDEFRAKGLALPPVLQLLCGVDEQEERDQAFDPADVDATGPLAEAVAAMEADIDAGADAAGGSAAGTKGSHGKRPNTGGAPCDGKEEVSKDPGNAKASSVPNGRLDSMGEGGSGASSNGDAPGGARETGTVAPSAASNVLQMGASNSSQGKDGKGGQGWGVESVATGGACTVTGACGGAVMMQETMWSRLPRTRLSGTWLAVDSAHAARDPAAKRHRALTMALKDVVAL
eukprot:jgi/Mesvir1/299/Mv13624-RA.1